MIAMTKTYTYEFKYKDYLEAIRALKKFRKRGVKLLSVTIVVDTEHWNKVKDLFQDSNNKIVVLVVE